MAKKTRPKIKPTHSSLHGEITIEEEVYINPTVFIDLSSKILIKKFTGISKNVVIYTHKHLWNHSNGRRKDIQKVIPVDLTIGQDVFIGEGAMILAVQKIGDGAVIGARSVLTKNVGPYEVWAGNPAKKIGERKDFDSDRESYFYEE